MNCVDSADQVEVNDRAEAKSRRYVLGEDVEGDREWEVAGKAGKGDDADGSDVLATKGDKTGGGLLKRG